MSAKSKKDYLSNYILSKLFGFRSWQSVLFLSSQNQFIDLESFINPLHRLGDKMLHDSGYYCYTMWLKTHREQYFCTCKDQLDPM